MAGLTDVVSGVQNFVTALSGASRQLTGSFTNISGQITNLSSLITSNASAIAAIQAAYVTTIAGNSSAFTLASTTGITNVVNDIRLLQGSSSQYGAVKVDGTTITAAAGVITAVTAPSTVVASSPITASTSADILLNNTSSYFDGPTVAQGSSGTWYVAGTVTITSATAANISAKLWDGTNIIASCADSVIGNGFCPMALSGYIVDPSSNLRISVRDVGTTTGKILFNQSGNSKDSTITAIRIA